MEGFLGVYDPAGITSLRVTNTSGNVFFETDHLQRRPCLARNASPHGLLPSGLTGAVVAGCAEASPQTTSSSQHVLRGNSSLDGGGTLAAAILIPPPSAISRPTCPGDASAGGPSDRRDGWAL